MKLTKKQFILAASATVALGGLGAITAAIIAPSQQSNLPQRPTTQTVAIEQGTLQGERNVRGKITYSDPQTILANTSGILTAAGPPNTLVNIGQTLFSINDDPTFLFRGSFPVWRELSEGIRPGTDVQQLEATLKELGYFNREPDQTFAAPTTTAIKAWQKDNHLEQTGTIPLGRIIFLPDTVRIDSHEIRIGAPASSGSAVIKTTSGNKIITGNMHLEDQALLNIDAPVNITLPQADITRGKITAIGSPAPTSPDSPEIIIPFIATLDDPSAAGNYIQTEVTITFFTETRENVFFVPVEALLAFDTETFGVEIVNPDGTRQRVRVKTEFFTNGHVQISGENIEKDKQVAVPS